MADLETKDDDDDAFDAIAKQTEAEAKMSEPFEICTDESGSGFLSLQTDEGQLQDDQGTFSWGRP